MKKIFLLITSLAILLLASCSQAEVSNEKLSFSINTSDLVTAIYASEMQEEAGSSAEENSGNYYEITALLVGTEISQTQKFSVVEGLAYINSEQSNATSGESSEEKPLSKISFTFDNLEAGTKQQIAIHMEKKCINENDKKEITQSVFYGLSDEVEVVAGENTPVEIALESSKFRLELPECPIEIEQGKFDFNLYLNSLYYDNNKQEVFIPLSEFEFTAWLKDAEGKTTEIFPIFEKNEEVVGIYSFILPANFKVLGSAEIFVSAKYKKTGAYCDISSIVDVVYIEPLNFVLYSNPSVEPGDNKYGITKYTDGVLQEPLIDLTTRYDAMCVAADGSVYYCKSSIIYKDNNQIITNVNGLGTIKDMYFDNGSGYLFIADTDGKIGIFDSTASDAMTAGLIVDSSFSNATLFGNYSSHFENLAVYNDKLYYLAVSDDNNENILILVDWNYDATSKTFTITPIYDYENCGSGFTNTFKAYIDNEITSATVNDLFVQDDYIYVLYSAIPLDLSKFSAVNTGGLARVSTAPFLNYAEEFKNTSQGSSTVFEGIEWNFLGNTEASQKILFGENNKLYNNDTRNIMHTEKPKTSEDGQLSFDTEPDSCVYYNTYFSFAQPASKTAEAFFNPVKVIGINSKKLVIADDGTFYYVDGDYYKFKNINRYVTVDLENFTIESVNNCNDEVFEGDIGDNYMEVLLTTNLEEILNDIPSLYYIDSAGNEIEVKSENYYKYDSGTEYFLNEDADFSSGSV